MVLNKKTEIYGLYWLSRCELSCLYFQCKVCGFHTRCCVLNCVKELSQVILVLTVCWYSVLHEAFQIVLKRSAEFYTIQKIWLFSSNIVAPPFYTLGDSIRLHMYFQHDFLRFRNLRQYQMANPRPLVSGEFLQGKICYGIPSWINYYWLQVPWSFRPTLAWMLQSGAIKLAGMPWTMFGS